MKKCKNCREHFQPFNSLMKYCQKDECFKAFIAEAKDKEWKKRKAKLKNDLLTVQDYLKVAQQVFNKWIRKRDEGLNCISCQKPCKKENAGHYFSSGGHANVRFDERNVNLQCEYCNTYLSGNLIEYQKHLKTRIGHENYVLLAQEAYKERKYTIEELKEIIIKYK